MKRSQLEEIILEELYIAVGEHIALEERLEEAKARHPESKPAHGTVPDVQDRKMTKSQIAKRKALGKKMMDNPRVKAWAKKRAAKKGYGDAWWPSFVWAAASNSVLGGPKGKKSKGGD